jgi:hypothetical protein
VPPDSFFSAVLNTLKPVRSRVTSQLEVWYRLFHSLWVVAIMKETYESCLPRRLSIRLCLLCRRR